MCSLHFLNFKKYFSSVSFMSPAMPISPFPVDWLSLPLNFCSEIFLHSCIKNFWIYVKKWCYNFHLLCNDIFCWVFFVRDIMLPFYIFLWYLCMDTYYFSVIHIWMRWVFPNHLLEQTRVGVGGMTGYKE